MADDIALKVETAIETFLGRLPLWRGGQRDAGKSLPSASPERKERSPKKDKDRRAREKEREKVKGREKDRDKDRDKDRYRDRKRGRESRSVSNKRSKDKKDRLAKNASRSRSRSPKERDPKERKSGGSFSSVAPVVAASPPPPSPLMASPAAPVPKAPSTAVPPDPNVPSWIADLIGNAKPSRREIMVPQPSVSRLIGRGGEHITTVCRTTGADVRVNQGTKDAGYSVACITGHPDKVEVAERMVRQMLGLSVTGTASKEIAIPNEHAQAVMNSLSRIRTQSGGCPMDLKSYPTMGWRAILGPASNEQLMVAEQLLTAALAEAMVVGIQRSV